MALGFLPARNLSWHMIFLVLQYLSELWSSLNIAHWNTFTRSYITLPYCPASGEGTLDLSWLCEMMLQNMCDCWQPKSASGFQSSFQVKNTACSKAWRNEHVKAYREVMIKWISQKLKNWVFLQNNNESRSWPRQNRNCPFTHPRVVSGAARPTQVTAVSRALGLTMCALPVKG